MKKINDFISQEAFQLYKISSVTYLFCYLYNFLQLKRSLQNDYLSSFNTQGEFISYNANKIVFIFNTSSGFLF